MNRNGKEMKYEATCLTAPQRCEIIAKLSKLNTRSKRALGLEYEVSEGAIRKVWDNQENMLQRIICCKSLSRHLLNLKMLPTSKPLKLYTTLFLTSTTNCFASVFKRKLPNICMMNCDDRLRRFNGTLTNYHWMSSVKKSCICGKWLYITCSNNKIWTLIFVKKIAHLIRMRT